MEIKPIAYFSSPLPEKFGVPRQAGLADSLTGKIVFEKEYAREEAVRGLEGFSHLWLIWGFHLNGNRSSSLTVRPPRLGGNENVGVFASRSPFRPNGMGLSAVRIEAVGKGEISVSGADLSDGTPIYDIKPYVPYSDSIADAKEGFTTREWDRLDVTMPETGLDREKEKALREILSLDPRPQYQNNPQRIYGLSFDGMTVKFKVEGRSLSVISISPLNGQQP